MPFPQNVFVISMAVGLFVFILSRVHYGRLREEFSWLWLLAGVVALVLAVWHHGLILIQQTLGFYAPASVVIFFGLVFLALIGLHASVKISRLTNIQKNLVQELALLREEMDRLTRESDARED